MEYRQHDIDNRGLAVRQGAHLQGLQKRFPGITAQDLQYTWTGHLSGTRTGEPYFARVADGLHAVAGCNGSGVARGALWGRLLVEMALGIDSPLLGDVLAQASPGLPATQTVLRPGRQGAHGLGSTPRAGLER